MKEINEELLEAWIRISTTINNERLVSEMTYNESLICNILYRNDRNHQESKITATDLCNKTKMLKSQMNRTLNTLEEKKIIVRERSKSDKRQVYIKMNLDRVSVYKSQHTKILELVDAIVEKYGKEKAMDLVRVFNTISDMAEEVLS